MEGLSIIEKSYKSLQNFKQAISNGEFTQLTINLKNYDMKTQSGIKNSIATILEVYKDELDLDKPIQKILTGEVITIKIPKDIDGFKDDLIDSLTQYINKRSGELWTIISNSNSVGGIYSV